MCLAFEKIYHPVIEKDEDIDNIFIAAFTNRKIAEDYIRDHFPGFVDDVVYKECYILE